jgi:NDP-sugar pyrophosphorylase family protein
MIAVILAGGKGTRLRPYTVTIPKPLLPLGDVPVIEVVIRQLAAAGIQRIAVALGRMAPLFEALVGDGVQWGIDIEYYREAEPLGTAGPLRLIQGAEDGFLVMNGDILTRLDYRALIAAHRKNDAAATIAVTRREVHVDYGVVVSGADGELEEYREKPVIAYEVSMGINVLEEETLAFIPPTGRFDMPELMCALHRAGRRIHCFRSNCYWQDIGRFDDYERASTDFSERPNSFLPGIPVRR